MKENEIIMYTTDDGQVEIEVRLEDENVWLTQNAMAELFDTTRNNITMHIKNIFEEGELPKEGNVQILHVANSDRHPFSFFRRFRTKFIMPFMDRRRRKLFIQGRMRKKNLWGLLHSQETSRLCGKLSLPKII